MLHFAEPNPHERVGTVTSNGRPAPGISASISEFERELTRDLVRPRLAAVMLKGKRLGIPEAAKSRVSGVMPGTAPRSLGMVRKLAPP